MLKSDTTNFTLSAVEKKSHGDSFGVNQQAAGKQLL